MPRPSRTPWFVYVLRCRDGSLYTGITTDVPRRLAQHAGRGRSGAKFLRGRGPLRLVFARAVGTRSLALKIERRIKSLPKRRKESLILSARLPLSATSRPQSPA